MHIFNIQLPLSPFKSNGGQKCLNSKLYAPCKIYINIFISGHLINWFVPTNFFQVIVALETQYNKIFRALGYKKKSREPAEERLQSLHCADCHGESYYILHIFLHVYFAYCRGGTFYISYIYVVYEIYVSPFWSLSR